MAHENTETTKFELIAVDQEQPGCLRIGRPTLRRTLERADGSRQTLRPASLQRAPDTVPVFGADPLTLDMAGSWAFEPMGGLRRVALCVRARALAALQKDGNEAGPAHGAPGPQ